MPLSRYRHASAARRRTVHAQGRFAILSVADDGDATRIGTIIARAFDDDPVNRWLFGRGRMAPTFTALARNIYLKHGFAHIDGGDRGAAMWLMDWRRKEAGLLATLRIASALAASAGLAPMRRGLALDAAFTAAHPAEPHAFLFAIGVVPEAQGKGIGGELLRAGLARVDRAGLACYLESTKATNVPLYRHFGFAELPALPLPDGCPPIWPMWRPARSA